MTQSEINKIICDLFDQSSKVILESKELSKKLEQIIQAIIQAYQNNCKVIIFGNGGSAADSQHFAAELIGRFLSERKSLAAIALSTDTSIITALGNDYGFEKIFSRQCESLVVQGDIVIGISTSGNSKNVLEAISVSKSKGATTIGISGGDGGHLHNLVDISLTVPSNSTPRIQEGHRIIIHIICELVENYFSKH